MPILLTRQKTQANPATVDPLVITWTANAPTAATTQTIADGSAVTGAETGQAIANLQAEIDALAADVQDLRSKLQN